MECAACRQPFIRQYNAERYCRRPECISARAKKRISANTEKVERTRLKSPKRPSGAMNRGGHTLSLLDRQFVAWDGEGEDGRYTLLACSDRPPLVDRNGLSTEDCLYYLCERDHRDKAHIWYSFGYDIAMILHDIPVFGDGPSLAKLKQTGHLHWHGFYIQYFARKIFQVKRGPFSYMAYDVFSFFGTSFERAIKDWLGDVPGLIAEGKAAREVFRDWPMERIIEYNQLELELLVSIMDRQRDNIKRAGLGLNSWHGPGALASWWLGQNQVDAHIMPPAEKMDEAVRSAYFGGRIDSAAWGSAKNIFHYDINSAYPYSFSKLPSLTQIKKWKRKRGGDPGEYDLCFCRWNLPRPVTHWQWGPFPFRLKDHSIIWPFFGSGWYWGCEVNAALRRYPEIEVVERWVPVGEIVLPFRASVESFMRRRLELKKLKDPANIALKSCANSWYGKMAQKVGWKGGKKPKFHSLIYAGWITAHCRGQISDALLAAGDAAVCIMTDSLWSLVPVEGKIDVGEGLGQWSSDDQIHSAVFCGAGLYQAFDKNGVPVTQEYKSRGFNDGLQSGLDYRQIIKDWEGALKGKHHNPHEFPARRFVGISLSALSESYAKDYGTFVGFNKELKSLPFYGDSKRAPEVFAGGYVYRQKGSNLHFQKPLEVGMTEVPLLKELYPVSYPYLPGATEHAAGDDFHSTLAARDDEDA